MWSVKGNKELAEKLMYAFSLFSPDIRVPVYLTISKTELANSEQHLVEMKERFQKGKLTNSKIILTESEITSSFVSSRSQKVPKKKEEKKGN